MGYLAYPVDMKLIVQIKLMPTDAQRAELLRTMETFNSACNSIAGAAFAERTANRVRLQKKVYGRIRAEFGLSAQMTVRAVAKVCDAYRRDLRVQPRFRLKGAMPYDERMLSYRGDESVSILTLGGRQHVLFHVAAWQRERLRMRRGQAELVFRRGAFYLLQTVEVEAPEERTAESFLGVDLGIVHIAVDSDGEVFSGAQLNGLRHRYHRIRRRLQKKGTKSAKRLLRTRRDRESRFARDVNHVVSKRLVAKAKDTGRGIALEDLKGIRARITARRAHRRQLSSWGFAELREFVEYKAVLSGVQVVFVDPRHTSQTCPACGCVDRRSRPSRGVFLCVGCGFGGPADTIAARNIASRAAVSPPHAEGPQPFCKPPTSGGGR